MCPPCLRAHTQVRPYKTRFGYIWQVILAPGGRRIGPVGPPHEVQDLVLMIRQNTNKIQRIVVE
jgi:hypothetical protein